MAPMTVQPAANPLIRQQSLTRDRLDRRVLVLAGVVAAGLVSLSQVWVPMAHVIETLGLVVTTYTGTIALMVTLYAGVRARRLGRTLELARQQSWLASVPLSVEQWREHDRRVTARHFGLQVVFVLLAGIVLIVGGGLPVDQALLVAALPVVAGLLAGTVAGGAVSRVRLPAGFRRSLNVGRVPADASGMAALAGLCLARFVRVSDGPRMALMTGPILLLIQGGAGPGALIVVGAWVMLMLSINLVQVCQRTSIETGRTLAATPFLMTNLVTRLLMRPTLFLLVMAGVLAAVLFGVGWTPGDTLLALGVWYGPWLLWLSLSVWWQLRLKVLPGGPGK